MAPDCSQNQPLTPIHSLTRQVVVLSLYEESLTWSSKSILWLSVYTYLINSFLPSKTFLRMHRFLLTYFIFITHILVGLREIAWTSKVFLQLSFCTCSLISQPNLYQHFSHVCSILFQSEVNTWMYLRKAIILQADSCHNLDPLHMICTNFQIHWLYSKICFHKVVI